MLKMSGFSAQVYECSCVFLLAVKRPGTACVAGTEGELHASSTTEPPLRELF
jgi:hypothetical protein